MRRPLAAAYAAVIVTACGSYGASDDTGPASDGGTDAASVGDAGRAGDAPNDGLTGTDHAVVVLATAQAEPFGVAASETDVFWSEEVAGKLRRVSIDGGAVSDVASYTGAPSNIAVRGGVVTWGDLGSTPGLRRLAVGGVIDRFYTASAATFAELADGTFAVVTSKDDSVVVVGADGGAPASLGTFMTPVDVIADGTTAVWTASAESKVWKLDLASKQISVLAAGEMDCQLLARNDDGVYWTSPVDSVIRRIDRNGATMSIAEGQSNPYGLAADDTGVYWLTDDGALRRWTNAGIETLASGQPTVALDQAQIRAHALALNAKYVVWLARTDVRRITK